MSEFEEIREGLQTKINNHEGIFVYLPNVSDWQKKEIIFHNAIHQAEGEIHQLQTVRNQYYHDYFKKWLYQLNPGEVILEVGAGAGHDLIPLLNRGYNLVESDISFSSIRSVKQKINNQYPRFKNQLIYLVADGQNLPLANSLVDAVFMVATFHHFDNPQKALVELVRVSKPGGLIILAMEPSRLMMSFTKIFRNFKSLRIYQGHSKADETHRGYTKQNFQSLGFARDKFLISNFQVLKIKRVWLLLGFLHYGLEGLFRLLKLKKRLVAPRWFEWLLLIIDEILLKIPIINQLNWHWIIIAKNLKRKT